MERMDSLSALFSCTLQWSNKPCFIIFPSPWVANTRMSKGGGRICAWTDLPLAAVDLTSFTCDAAPFITSPHHESNFHRSFTPILWRCKLQYRIHTIEGPLSFRRILVGHLGKFPSVAKKPGWNWGVKKMLQKKHQPNQRIFGISSFWPGIFFYLKSTSRVNRLGVVLFQICFIAI